MKSDENALGTEDLNLLIISKEHSEILSKIMRLDNKLRIEEIKEDDRKKKSEVTVGNVNTQNLSSEFKINPHYKNINMNMMNSEINSDNVTSAEKYEKSEKIERSDNSHKSSKIKDNYKINIIPDKTDIVPDTQQNFENFALSSIRSSMNTSDIKDDFFSSRSTKNKELIIAINPKQTNIHKVLKINENDIKINKTSLSYLNESKFKILNLELDSVIYDMDLLKLNNLKHLQKVSLKYSQITKNYFKYFKSIYSSTVWQDRPLLKIPLSNIDKVIAVKCKSNLPKILKNKNIYILIQFFIKFDKSKNYIHYDKIRLPLQQKFGIAAYSQP
jgi:hypothetical protein